MATSAPSAIQSTAGAVSVINVKGEVSMQKVKVHRYISGKRPEYAPDSASGEETDDEFTIHHSHKREVSPELQGNGMDIDDARLRRLRQRDIHVDKEERMERHRHIHAPTIEEDPEERHQRRREDDESENEELDDAVIEARRAMIRLKMRSKLEKEKELMDLAEEQKSEKEESEEESEYEECTDSEEEMAPRLRPVFVKKSDRVTVQDEEQRKQKEEALKKEPERRAVDRRKQTLKMVEEEAKKNLMDKSNVTDPSELIDSGDENDEAEYEAWKLRELKRIKRDREDRDDRKKQKEELERIRNLTEDERRAEERANPRVVTNKALKGKQKFMQKYYHRGVFFLDDDDDVYKRDFAQPTLEDHFDKTLLPKVMQVKNFGRSGRSKYTHLVDQDTTKFDSPWVSTRHSNQSDGRKQMFDRPTAKKRKMCL